MKVLIFAMNYKLITMTKKIPNQRKSHYNYYGPSVTKNYFAIYHDLFELFEIRFSKNRIEYVDHFNCLDHYIEVSDFDLNNININRLLTWWKKASKSTIAKRLSGQAYIDFMSRSYSINFDYIHGYTKNIKIS